MPDDYREMWAGLGLDLEAHDGLLEALSSAYRDVFLSQSDRPEGMQYFDFVMSEVHGLRIKELLDARRDGRKVVGSFCVFVPEELVLAVDGVSVGLCAGAEFNFEGAETLLPRSTCALIKSAFGFKLARVCPYLEASDMLVGENTCDGKKKAYEVLRRHVENLYVMDLPQTKSDEGRALLRAEYLRFAEALQGLCDRRLTVEGLRKGIDIANRKRQALRRLCELRAADPAPISGLDALLVNQVFFYDDPGRFTDSVNRICDEIEERSGSGRGVRPAGAPRIVVSGCPMAVPNWKLTSIVEGAGAVIVGEESCVGERGSRHLTEESGNTVEALIDDLVDRYFRIDCAVFTPNPSRLSHLEEMVAAYRADGVIHYSLQFCQPYQIESGEVERGLERAGIPCLSLDTDYSQEDVGQIRTRVEAFLERVSP